MPTTHFAGSRRKLRARAQKRLRDAPERVSGDEGSFEARRLVQELQIHQIELELQNEELAQAKGDMELALEKYIDLYEFAPVGFLSLDHSGHAIDANLTLGEMMGLDRTSLLGRKFEVWVQPSSRKKFGTFLARVFASRAAETCELMIQRRGGSPFWVSLESKRSHRKLATGDWCRIALIDITDRKKTLEAQHRIEVLTSSNRKLTLEIVRRRRLEQSLIKSKQVAFDLLAESKVLQARLRKMSHRSLLIEEEQRKTISRALHDEISQLLVGINAHLEAFSRVATSRPESIRSSVEPFRQMVSEALRTIHRFAGELRPAMLDDIGLVAALRDYVGRMPPTGDRKIRIVASAAADDELRTDQQTMLYRVAQEALTNMAKHSGADRILVSLRKVAGGIRLTVADNGKAFDVRLSATNAWRERFGLIGMRERVEMMNGSFAVTSVRGKGTTVTALVPLEGPAKPACPQSDR